MEILSAIIGAIVAGIITWLLARKKPQNYVLCEVLPNYYVGVDLPHTQILYRNVTVKELNITRIICRNIGSQVLDKPKLTIQLASSSNILGITASIFPERENNEQTVVQADSTEIQVIPQQLFPNSLNQETLFIDIFSDKPIDIVSIIGTGMTTDNYGWTAKFIKQAYSEIPTLSLRGHKSHIYRPLLAYANLILVIVATIVYWWYQLSRGLLTLNLVLLTELVKAPLFWGWAVWVLASLIGAFILGMSGWFLPIPIPFTNRTIIIRFYKHGRYMLP